MLNNIGLIMLIHMNDSNKIFNYVRDIVAILIIE